MFKLLCFMLFVLAVYDVIPTFSEGCHQDKDSGECTGGCPDGGKCAWKDTCGAACFFEVGVCQCQST